MKEFTRSSPSSASSLAADKGFRRSRDMMMSKTLLVLLSVISVADASAEFTKWIQTAIEQQNGYDLSDVVTKYYVWPAKWGFFEIKSGVWQSVNIGGQTSTFFDPSQKETDLKGVNLLEALLPNASGVSEIACCDVASGIPTYYKVTAPGELHQVTQMKEGDSQTEKGPPSRSQPSPSRKAEAGRQAIPPPMPDPMVDQTQELLNDFDRQLQDGGLSLTELAEGQLEQLERELNDLRKLKRRLESFD